MRSAHTRAQNDDVYRYRFIFYMAVINVLYFSENFLLEKAALTQLGHSNKVNANPTNCWTSGLDAVASVIVRVEV